MSKLAGGGSVLSVCYIISGVKWRKMAAHRRRWAAAPEGIIWRKHQRQAKIETGGRQRNEKPKSGRWRKIGETGITKNEKPAAKIDEMLAKAAAK
jgi:hypothetical protein